VNPIHPRICGLLALLAVFAWVGPLDAGVGREPSAELNRDLGEAWTMLDAGNLTRASEIYTDLLGSVEGRDHAEVYYGLSVIAWENRDAREAWKWLTAARRGAEGSGGWNPGLGGQWQHRIEERLRFIEGRFTVRLLVAPERGEALPPMADPLPRDPVLAEFAARVPDLVAAQFESAERSIAEVFLPNGSWWVGDRLEWHAGGQLETTEAGESWQLAARSGRAEELYEARAAELAAGGSLGRELIGKLMIARRAPAAMVDEELRRRKAEQLAAEHARRRPQMEAMRARQRALLESGRAEEAAAMSLGFASAEKGSALLTRDEVTSKTLPDLARELGEVWTEPGWHMRYAADFPDKATRWSLELPELGVVVRIDKGGELIIQGTSTRGKAKVKESLAEWRLGGRPNRVDLWFDGTRLKVEVNGQTVGPIEVSRFAPEGTTRWRLGMTEDSARMFDLRVEAFTGF